MDYSTCKLMPLLPGLFLYVSQSYSEDLARRHDLSFWLEVTATCVYLCVHCFQRACFSGDMEYFREFRNLVSSL
jgi:L-lysine 2,3-aminomutase